MFRFISRLVSKEIILKDEEEEDIEDSMKCTVIRDNNYSIS